MKRAFVTCLGTVFAATLLSASLRGLARDMDLLQERVDRSDRDLQEARAEIDRLRQEESGRSELDEAPPPNPETTDIRTLYRDILAPSVQVSADSGVGGGTLLFSREQRSYVITAFHVVQKSKEPAEVRLYDDQGELTDEVDADLVASDEKKDLALLRLRTERVYTTVAHLATRASLRSVRVFTPLYAIGCPLGHDPLPTRGEVASLRKEVGGETFRMMTAPTIFGNSGGGVFHRETRELIGVSVMLCTYDGAVSTPVPHLGIFVSMETVYDWLDTLHYQFLYDSSFTIDECERARDEDPPASGSDR